MMRNENKICQNDEIPEIEPISYDEFSEDNHILEKQLKGKLTSLLIAFHVK